MRGCILCLSCWQRRLKRRGLVFRRPQSSPTRDGRDHCPRRYMDLMTTWVQEPCDTKPTNALDLVERTAHATPAAVKHMRVNHGGRHIAVTKQLLNRSNVVPGLQHVCSK